MRNLFLWKTLRFHNLKKLPLDSIPFTQNEKCKLSKQKQTGFCCQEFTKFHFLKHQEVICNVLGLSVSQESNIQCHYREDVLVEMNNAFCLSPLLSSCPCTHFSSWDTSMCGKLIYRENSLPTCFTSFILLRLFFLLRNSLRGKMAQDFKSLDCLETPLLISILLWLSNSLDCWAEEQFAIRFFSGVPTWQLLIPSLLQNAQSNPFYPLTSLADL